MCAECAVAIAPETSQPAMMEESSAGTVFSFLLAAPLNYNHYHQARKKTVPAGSLVAFCKSCAEAESCCSWLGAGSALQALLLYASCHPQARQGRPCLRDVLCCALAYKCRVKKCQE